MTTPRMPCPLHKLFLTLRSQAQLQRGARSNPCLCVTCGGDVLQFRPLRKAACWQGHVLPGISVKGQKTMRAVVVSLCLSTVLLAGCANQVNYRADSWVGHHREELIQAWGPPSLELPLSEPGMLVGSSTIVYTQEPGDYTLKYGDLRSTCRMVFQATEAGVISSLAYHRC